MHRTMDVGKAIEGLAVGVTTSAQATGAAKLRALHREAVRTMPKAEEQEWVTQRDPITLHGQWLMDNGVAPRAALDTIQQDLIKEMDAAMEFAGLQKKAA